MFDSFRTPSAKIKSNESHVLTFISKNFHPFLYLWYGRNTK
jgi:hypothetical protein